MEKNQDRTQLTVLNEQIRDKALKLSMEFGSQFSTSENHEASTLFEEMLFYCVEHDLKHCNHNQLGEELYLITFLLNGNSESRIIFYRNLRFSTKKVYIKIAIEIIEWLKTEKFS